MISVIYAYWRHMEGDIWFNPGWDEGFNPFSDPMINFSSKGVVDIHLRSFPWEVFQNLIHNMCSEMIIFKIAYRNNNNLYECNCTRLNCEHLMSITLLLVNNSHGIANCRKTKAICHCNQESFTYCPFVITEYAPNSFTVQCWLVTQNANTFSYIPQNAIKKDLWMGFSVILKCKIDTPYRPRFTYMLTYLWYDATHL